jgi:hypothetical protein
VLRAVGVADEEGAVVAVLACDLADVVARVRGARVGQVGDRAVLPDVAGAGVVREAHDLALVVDVLRDPGQVDERAVVPEKAVPPRGEDVVLADHPAARIDGPGEAEVGAGEERDPGHVRAVPDERQLSSVGTLARDPARVVHPPGAGREADDRRPDGRDDISGGRRAGGQRENGQNGDEVRASPLALNGSLKDG